MLSLLQTARGTRRETGLPLRALCLLFFIFSAAIVNAQVPRTCQACGVEDLTGTADVCANCKEPFPKAAELPIAAEKKSPAEEERESAFAAASLDVRLARENAKKPFVALALYENAQALLAFDVGAEYNSAAAEKILEEKTKLQKRIFESTRNLALIAKDEFNQGRQIAAELLQSKGRVSSGDLWMPASWLQIATPQQIARMRKTLFHPCSACAGCGREVCDKCNGRAGTPCKNRGCKNGVVIVEEPNALQGSQPIKRRAKCTECKGTGKVPCPSCNGTGFKYCHVCQGNGKAPICKTCNGEGLKVEKTKDAELSLCPRCGGDGHTK